METEIEKGLNQQEIAKEPKKSKRKLYGLIALAVAVLIYILVPSGAPTTENEEGVNETTEQIISETVLGSGKLTLKSFTSKKRMLGKWVISGIVSNTSDKAIEVIEFLAEFSDNTEYVKYNKLIEAGETNHEFTVKVTGHKGESLESLKIGSVN